MFIKNSLKIFCLQESAKEGLVRDLNPGPRASEAQIIPLDQRATSLLVILCSYKKFGNKFSKITLENGSSLELLESIIFGKKVVSTAYKC